MRADTHTHSLLLLTGPQTKLYYWYSPICFDCLICILSHPIPLYLPLPPPPPLYFLTDTLTFLHRLFVLIMRSFSANIVLPQKLTYLIVYIYSDNNIIKCNKLRLSSVVTGMPISLAHAKVTSTHNMNNATNDELVVIKKAAQAARLCDLSLQ